MLLGLRFLRRDVRIQIKRTDFRRIGDDELMWTDGTGWQHLRSSIDRRARFRVKNLCANCGGMDYAVGFGRWSRRKCRPPARRSARSHTRSRGIPSPSVASKRGECFSILSGDKCHRSGINDRRNGGHRAHEALCVGRRHRPGGCARVGCVRVEYNDADFRRAFRRLCRADDSWEDNPIGDIPDTQVYVPFAAADGSFTLSVPEGRAQTSDGTRSTSPTSSHGVRIDAYLPMPFAGVGERRPSCSPVNTSACGFTVAEV